MRLAWLTDIHLNFLDATERRRFLESVKERADVVAVSGDIGESHNVVKYLQEMEEIVQKPIHFVLGNHDFYRGSIAETRVEVAELAKESKCLTYLTATGVAELTPATAIVGHDGWADGRLGDYENSEVILNDHVLIAEISQWYRNYDRDTRGLKLDKQGLKRTLKNLADEAAQHFESVVTEAASRYRNIIAVTHIPPFREAAWYQGKTSGEDWLPYFACKVVGDVLERTMRAYPQSELLVLCGHTHGGGELQVLDNLQVLTGEARYKHPVIRRVFEIE